jgi:hypothetical protein
MDEKKPNESVYSKERTQIATLASPHEGTSEAGSREAEETTPLSEPTQKPAISEVRQETPIAAGPVGPSPLKTKSGEYSLVGDFLEFLSRTKYVWLGLAGVAIGIMVLVSMMKGVAERARIAQEKRREEAAATVTPDRLIARCGKPVEDSTKEVYPVLMRTMSYQPRDNEKLVFEFSRTAEDKSDWVFLSMKDESGTKSYDTPEAKIAALPCLDSKK